MSGSAQRYSPEGEHGTAVVAVPPSATVPTNGQEVKGDLPTQPVTSTTCAVITATFGGNTAVPVLLQVTP